MLPFETVCSATEKTQCSWPFGSQPTTLSPDPTVQCKSLTTSSGLNFRVQLQASSQQCLKIQTFDSRCLLLYSAGGPLNSFGIEVEGTADKATILSESQQHICLAYLGPANARNYNVIGNSGQIAFSHSRS